MKFKLLLILFLSCLFIQAGFCGDEKKIVRVAISNQSFSSRDYQTIKITGENIIKIIDMSQNARLEDIPAQSIVEINMDENFYNISIDENLQYERLRGPLLISSNAEIQIIDLNRKGSPAKYKGMIEIRNSKLDSYFNVINIIDMQNYLRGVVPNEMPVSFGLEALKAQAVAARNYAARAAIAPFYDVVDSTASQVYYGANSYREISDEAVEKTNGIYAIYNEEPISALYFSTSAGITDDWDDVFSDGTNLNLHPYLKARYDNEKQKAIKNEEDFKKFLSSDDSGLDINSPKFRWSVEFSRRELEEILHDTLQQQSKAGLVSPKYDGDIKLSGLKEIKPVKRTQSGKIVELEIIANSGTYKVYKELGIRRVLKKNNSMLASANFYIETEGEEPLEASSEDNKEEAKGIIKLFDFSDDKYPSTFKFTGGGFGHGVGMSQFGAYNLSKAGKKYPEILNHYYTDIKISTVPKTVLYNEYNISYKSEFYFDKDTFTCAYLYLNNQKGASEFPFKINDFEFLETKKIAQNKVIKINITEYLNQGQNTITFYPLTRENKGKYVKFRVEFQ